MTIAQNLVSNIQISHHPIHFPTKKNAIKKNNSTCHAQKKSMPRNSRKVESLRTVVKSPSVWVYPSPHAIPPTFGAAAARGAAPYGPVGAHTEWPGDFGGFFLQPICLEMMIMKWYIYMIYKRNIYCIYIYIYIHIYHILYRY